MKIVAMGSVPFDLELACFGTLSRCIRDGHEVHIIIAKSDEDKTYWSEIQMEALRKVSQKIGVSRVYFTNRFNFSNVTQDNANVLASFLRPINPLLVIIPFWKTSNQRRKILANTSLVACRGIGSILMYELDRNTSFLPTVYFTASANEISTKTSCLAEHRNLVSELGPGMRVNSFILNLLNMKTYQLPLFVQASTSIETSTVGLGNVANNYYQQFGSVDNKMDNAENVWGEINQPMDRPYSLERGIDVLVEVFESHRMLLADRDDAPYDHLNGETFKNKIVSIGAHPDDVEQGMAGTVAKHAANGDDVHIIVCTLGIGGPSGDQILREREAREAAHILGAKLHSLDYHVLKLNKPSIEFENVIKKVIDEINPDRIYVHSPFDYHQIHAAVSECTTNAAKDVKQILFYEVISSTNPDFKPNAYVNITDYIDLKLKSISAHQTQRKLYLHPIFTRSIAHTRYALGKLGSNPNGMAEAFSIHKFVVADKVNNSCTLYGR